MELPDAPQGWALKSLIEINPETWSCHLWGPEAYVYGYGSSARYAMLDALRRIEEGDFFARLSGMRKHSVNVDKLIEEITSEHQAPIRDEGRRF